MHLLTNFPFEMFGERKSFPFEYLSFGPAMGRKVGNRIFPYDISIDTSSASIEDIHREVERLAGDFRPDAMMLWWPDQEPLPEGLERCPYPVVGVMSDYNLTLPCQTRLWSVLDLLLVDGPGLQVLGRLPFARVEPWCQFSFRPDVHKIYTDSSGIPLERDIDICFMGNFNPEIQRERHAWTPRLLAIPNSKIFLGHAPQGEEYGRMLSRSKIAFNRSIRGEINLRCFEAPACGAVLLMERENTEIRSFFEPDKEVVLYGPQDLEQKVRWLLEHDEERETIAKAAHRRVQEYRLAKLCEPLEDLFRSVDISQRKPEHQAARALCRAEMMVLSWAPFHNLIQAFKHAQALAPQDPRVYNNYAAALIHRQLDSKIPPQEGMGGHWIELFERAAKQMGDYLPPRQNLRFLMRVLGMKEEAKKLGQQCLEILKSPLRFEQIDGATLPLGFHGRQVAYALALGQALRSQDLSGVAQWHREWALDETEPVLAPYPGKPLELRESDLCYLSKDRSPPNPNHASLSPVATRRLDPCPPFSMQAAPSPGSSPSPSPSMP